MTLLTGSLSTAQVNAGATILSDPVDLANAFNAIAASSPALIECDMNVPSGTTVVIAGSKTVPTVDGVRVATNVNNHAFTVPINVGTFSISAISTANPTHLTVNQDIPSGSIVTIINTSTTPATVGTFTWTRVDATHGTIPVNVTNVATGTGTGTIVAASGGTFDIPARVPTSHAITAATVANPTVITCATAVLDGSVVVISGSDSTPKIDGTWTAHYIDSTHFSINANVLSAATTGTVVTLDAPTGLTALRVMSFAMTARGGSGTGAGTIINLEDTSGVVVGYVPLVNLTKDVQNYEFTSGVVLSNLRVPLTAGAGLQIVGSGGTLATTTSIDYAIIYEVK